MHQATVGFLSLYRFQRTVRYRPQSCRSGAASLNDWSCAVFLPLALPLRGGKAIAVSAGMPARTIDPVLVTALRKAHAMVTWERGMPAMQAGPPSRYDTNILRLAFLSPDIQRDILDGRQPASLTLQSFKSIAVPLAWSKQRKVLGYT